jgi:hypothetical protein
MMGLDGMSNIKDTLGLTVQIKYNREDGLYDWNIEPYIHGIEYDEVEEEFIEHLENMIRKFSDYIENNFNWDEKQELEEERTLRNMVYK